MSFAILFHVLIALKLKEFVADGFDWTGFERIFAGVVFLQGEGLALNFSDAGVADGGAREKERRGLAAEVTINAGVLNEEFTGTFRKIVCRG